MSFVKDEILKLLDDIQIPAKIINSIDYSLTMLEESDQLEGSLIHQSKRISEDYFFNFIMAKEKHSNKIEKKLNLKLNNQKDKITKIKDENISDSNLEESYFYLNDNYNLKNKEEINDGIDEDIESDENQENGNSYKYLILS